MNQLIPVALYARVSTAHQHADNQLTQLREYCQRMGFQIVAEYVDIESGSRAENEREALREMMEAATVRRFHRVIVWALDRLTREGPLKTLQYIERLKQNRVELWSATEEHFRTSGPAGELFIAIAAWMAQQERIRRIERIKAGQQRARAQGREPGRRWRIADQEKMNTLRESGMSLSAIARKTGLSKATVGRRLTNQSKGTPRK